MAAKKVVEKARYFYGVGRRKASAVRAKYYPGEKDISFVVDGKKSSDYFPRFYEQLIEELFIRVGVRTGSIELFARGGGVSGQAEASRLAIAKALLVSDEALRPVLRSFGYLTTDNRKVLPKRPGLKKARKREQWSKR